MNTTESNVTGPVTDTAAGDIVSILVSPDPPYGVEFEPDMDGNAAVIKSFEKLPSGKFGPLQKHGGLHHGDVLFAINEIHLDSVSHNDAMIMINDRNILKKTFKFINNREYYRRRRGVHSNTAMLAESSKASFLSSIRRYRISTDESNRKYVEYEIACQLRVPGNRIQKDVVHKWSVYKRYSEFEKLNNALRISLGWQLEGIVFPSAYTFSLNKLSPDFIEQRRDELNRYWQRVIVIDRVCDFTKHHCSPDIKKFLDVEEVTKGAKMTMPELTSETTEEEKLSEEEKRMSTNRKPLPRVTSMRKRNSLNSSSSSLPTTPRSPTIDESSEKPSSSLSEEIRTTSPSIPTTISPRPPPPPPPRRPSVIPNPSEEE